MARDFGAKGAEEWWIFTAGLSLVIRVQKYTLRSQEY